jgi:predicted CXXCH cytochrome family protein
MTQYATPETVRANFDGVILTNDGTRFVLSRRRDELWVHMEHAGPMPEGLATPEPLDIRVGLRTGSHHMQVFWIPSGEGNTQLGFPFTWLIPEQRWVPRGATFIRPPDLGHRSEIWNVVCSRCHATGIEPRVDPVNRTVDTRAAELGISCEACHGPGQRHVEARRSAAKGSPEPDAATLADEIVQPRKLPAARSSQVCGFCHSMKWIDKSEPWEQRGFRFRPGDDLEQTTPIIRPATAAGIPRLKDYLDRNPDLLQDFFWSDGMVRVSGREYNGLIESPCYQGGKFSCVSCHSMHESDPDDQLARNRTDRRACLQCHETFGETARLTAHTHHAADSSGSECYNCHLPHTTYGVLKAIRSHQISSPNVADEIATGRPNACNLCHLDRTLEWTASQLGDWYRRPAPTLTEAHRILPDSVRLALTGDAGQRALVAWHFSWRPALQASATNWVPAILAEMLDDPYAAVRCVAERSLRATSSLVPPGYDYVADPRSRPAIRDVVWERWSRGVAFQNESSRAVAFPTLFHPEDLKAQGVQFDAWIARRDTGPVRLRE